MIKYEYPSCAVSLDVIGFFVLRVSVTATLYLNVTVYKEPHKANVKIDVASTTQFIATNPGVPRRKVFCAFRIFNVTNPPNTVVAAMPVYRKKFVDTQ